MLATAPAFAQAAAAHRITVGAAAGVANPFHGDFDFAAPAWQVDVRIDSSRHFAFGPFYEAWRHGSEEILSNQSIAGPSGPLGRVDHVSLRTVHHTRSIGASFLARGAAGRVTVSGGGGLGVLLYSRDFSQLMAGCEPASLCRDFSQTFTNGSVSAHAQVGADLAVAPRIAVMGQFRLVLPLEDAGGGHATFLGGVRVGF